MGFLDKAINKIKENMASKYSQMSGINRTLCSKEYNAFIDELDNKAKTIESELKLSSDIMSYRDENAVAHEVEQHVNEVAEAKKECASDIDKINSEIAYAEVRSAKDMKELTTRVNNKIDKAADNAKDKIEKSSQSILKTITDKLKSLVKKPEAGIDLRGVYNKTDGEKKLSEIEEEAQKQSEYRNYQTNLGTMREAINLSANRNGHLGAHTEAMNIIREQQNDARIVHDSKDFGKFLRSFKLSDLAQINKFIRETQKNFLDLDFDNIATRKETAVTELQIRNQLDKVHKLKEQIDEQLDIKSKALQVQKESLADFDKVRLNNDIRETYVVVDMQTLGLMARQTIERQDCIVMMSRDMQAKAIVNGGKADYPAAFVVDHNGAVYSYDTFEQCDDAKNIGLTNPDRLQRLITEGLLQNNEEYSLNGRVEAYFNYVRDMIAQKDYLNNLAMEYSRASGSARSNASYTSQELQRMQQERERLENSSDFIFDSTLDYIRDADAALMERMGPLIIEIKKEMEAREAVDHDQLLTGAKLRSKYELVDGPNGKENAKVYVLSASMTGTDRYGQTSHPTMNIVCDEAGAFRSAYYSDEFHDTASAYLGLKVADAQTKYIDVSLFVNNETVRGFLEQYPSIREVIENNCNIEKFYEDRGFTKEDVAKAAEQLDIEQEERE